MNYHVLNILGHFMKNWKRRWFSLRGDKLYYYEKPVCGLYFFDYYPSSFFFCFCFVIVFHQNAPKESGVIPLKGCKVENAEEKRDKPFCFHISYPDDPKAKDYFICADEVAQMNTWIAAIVEAGKL